MTKAELLALTPADFNFETHTLRINKSYQRLHREDVITPPKTLKSNRTIVFIIIIYVDEEQYIRNQKKIVKKFSISYNEVGNILATENQRAKIIYAIEIK